MTEEKDALPSDAENSGLKPQAPDKDDKAVPPPDTSKETADPSKQPS